MVRFAVAHDSTRHGQTWVYVRCCNFMLSLRTQHTSSGGPLQTLETPKPILQQNDATAAHLRLAGELAQEGPLQTRGLGLSEFIRMNWLPRSAASCQAIRPSNPQRCSFYLEQQRSRRLLFPSKRFPARHVSNHSHDFSSAIHHARQTPPKLVRSWSTQTPPELVHAVSINRTRARRCTSGSTPASPPRTAPP